MKSKDGFTLLEVIIAIVVLTIALLGLAQMILISIEKYDFARWDTKATQVAQAKIENLKSLFGGEIDSGVDDGDLINGEHGPELVALSTENSYGEPTSFWVSWQVSDLSGGQKLVAVTVTPPVPDPNRNETITIMSQFAP
jgi:prepilin-type N-terminal cleavage/methylation domain-containing protein